MTSINNFQVASKRLSYLLIQGTPCHRGQGSFRLIEVFVEHYESFCTRRGTSETCSNELQTILISKEVLFKINYVKIALKSLINYS